MKNYFCFFFQNFFFYCDVECGAGLSVCGRAGMSPCHRAVGDCPSQVISHAWSPSNHLS